MDVDIFLTLRFIEWCKLRGKNIEELLKAVGFKVYLASIKAGANIDDNVLDHLYASKMAIIFGSETYGEVTKSNVNTRTELNVILEEKKPYFLIKMCNKFVHIFPRSQLSFTSISYIEWMEDKPMPVDLIKKIQDKFFELFPQHPLALKVHNCPPVCFTCLACLF